MEHPMGGILSRRMFGILILLAIIFVPACFVREALGASKPPQNKTPVIGANLEGHVVDISGKPVANAIVSLENLETQQEQTAQSSLEGDFRFTQFPAGEYRLKVTAPGYKTFVVAQLPIVAGDAARANAILEFGNSTEETIGSLASVISRIGRALAGKSVSDLPENQRNFVNLVQVSAGANEGSTNGSASGSRPGAQHQSSAVSVGGQPEMTNNSMIDGMDNNERINATIVVHPSVESIASVQILANAYPSTIGSSGRRRDECDQQRRWRKAAWIGV